MSKTKEHFKELMEERYAEEKQKEQEKYRGS